MQIMSTTAVLEVDKRMEGPSPLREALARLPLLERFVIALHFAGGMSVANIAASLSIPERTIVHRLNRALAAVRQRCALAAGDPGEAERILSAISTGAAAPSGLKRKVESTTLADKGDH